MRFVVSVPVRNGWSFPLALIVLLGLLPSGCSDNGGGGTEPPPPGGPAISRLVPDRTIPGDTVLVEGSGFGESQGSSTVVFPTGSGQQTATILQGGWNPTVIRALVPQGAVSGGVVVQVDMMSSNPAAFQAAPAVVTFLDDVQPLFQSRCGTCHGESGPQAGLTVVTVEGLLEGGTHGPAVIPRRSGESILAHKISPNPPFGNRMPLGGPYLSESQILLVEDWIDQGLLVGTAPGPMPVLSTLVPHRTVTGDTLVIEGTDFGQAQGDSRVVFSTSSGTVDAQVESWADTRVSALIPAAAVSGPVRVLRDGRASNQLEFDVAPALVSYQNDLVPLLQVKGCVSCHGGTNNLFVTPYASLMEGTSDHGPVVIPRRSGGSVIVQKVSPSPPFGDRMPLGGALSEEETLLLADWIDQGARNN